ncbi:MAG: phage portal protein [Gordonibacter sp.]|uniref:phage portal protein n=1 Tax=Gordonibacter sp. TaxID=1968902 RepID=UPI002FCC1874
MQGEQTVYSIPQHVRDYIDKSGYEPACGAMEGHIKRWWDWMRSYGDFYDYDEVDSDSRRFKVHRLSIKPAKRVAKEWASLILTDNTLTSCKDQACTDWLSKYFSDVNFYSLGQGSVQKAFGIGTAAWALWVDTSNAKMIPRRYDARMIVPLSWDDDCVSECAFCTRASVKGKMLDQLQMHTLETDGYHIRTVFFNLDGNHVTVDGMIDDLPTKCPTPTFAIIKPAIENTVVDASPYGMSVFEDAIDAVKSVDLAYDAIYNEIDLGKMRVFLGESMFDNPEDANGKKQAIPFGKSDAVVFRKLAAADDLIKEFAPKLRTEYQVQAYRTALQTLGDLTGFGLSYFDIDDSGGIKTATEVSSDNSALMRNIRRHENLLGGSIVQISHAAMHCAREFFGANLPEEGEIAVNFDDSIITDTAAEKQQDMAEVGTTMNAWEYRVKWYGEDEATARKNVAEIGRDAYDAGGFGE